MGKQSRRRKEAHRAREKAEASVSPEMARMRRERDLAARKKERESRPPVSYTQPTFGAKGRI